MNIQLLNPAHIPQAIANIGADSVGQKIMSKKAQILGFEIQNLSFEALNILKQEAISVGADCATPKGTIKHQGESKAILFATSSQLERIITKLKIQPFKLKELSISLSKHLNAHPHNTVQLMVIINATPDSFYTHSRYNGKSAIDRIYSLLEKQIDIIDIGAASSRPGSELIDAQIEIERLTPILQEIKTHSLYKKATFSIDTYNAQTADFALSHGFCVVNDVSGFTHPQMANITAQYKAKAVLMHTKGTPKEMQSLTHTYKHLFNDIDAFFAEKIEILRESGVEEIILDIGFGFAKESTQNLALVKHLSHFKHFDLPLLVGASRKNTIGQITGRDTEQRLAGTLALHLFALQNGANILRIHDEDEHIDMLKIYKAMQ